MTKYLYILVTFFFTGTFCKIIEPRSLFDIAIAKPAVDIANYIFWPNASVPFYVNPDHFDHEQSLILLQALAMFAFRTCLKFAPVMAPPGSNEHVLVLENPTGLRRCVFDTSGHSVFEPHRVVVGYDCLQSPQLDMIIMRALGFPFEHNRLNRDVYIQVLEENIEPGSMNLYTMESSQPIELRAIPYDVNSVMHFGNRDFSKNGHRTILFKDHTIQQTRTGLTKLDLKKIETVYGPECRARDRQEKIQLCQSYSGINRRKRDIESEIDPKEIVMSKEQIDRQKRDAKSVELEMSSKPNIIRKKRDIETVTQSLRVNPEITPPPDAIKQTLTELGIDDAVQEVVEQVYKVSALALENARKKYCNNTKPTLRTKDENVRNNTDILGIIEMIAHYAQGMVEHAVANLTVFCKESDTIEIYQRTWCRNERCRDTYRSTKTGNVRYSTKHYALAQSTNIRGYADRKKIYVRASNDSEEATTETRKKRDIEDVLEDKSLEIQSRKDVEEHKEENFDEERDEDRKEGKEDKDGKHNDKNKDDIILRAGTGIPHRDARRRSSSRYKYEMEDEHMAQSSISTENNVQHKQRQKEKSQKHRQSIKRQKKHSDDSYHKQSVETDRNSNEEDQRESLDVEDRDSTEVKKSVERLKSKRPKKREHKETEYKERDTETLTQKKIVKYQKVPDIVKLSKANKEFYNDRMWPGGVIRYIIQEDTTYDVNDMRRRLAEVNDILRRKTCVRLKEITEEKAKQIDDYLVIDNSQDYVTGRVGGRQSFGSIELFRGDQHRQHTAMMVMAMLGFYFEVARHDRDEYVRIHLRHVRPDKLHHFEKIRADATLPLPYDYYSATHPAWQFWRQLGRTGISTVATYKHQDPDGSVMKSLGQNSKLLSDIDIVKINSVYGNKCLNNLRSSSTNESIAFEPLKPKYKRRQNRKVTVAI